MLNETREVDGASTVAGHEELQSRSRDVNWYVKDLPELPPATQELFEKYSGIPADKVKKHVYDIVCLSVQ